MSKKEHINFLQELYSAIQNSDKGNDKKSYTKFLIKNGKNMIAKKVAEESFELIIDYLKGSKKRVVEESADLIYHLLVLLYSRKIKLKDIEKELLKRRNVRRK